MKDVRLPKEMQRAMAAEAEATRDARAKVMYYKVGKQCIGYMHKAFATAAKIASCARGRKWFCASFVDYSCYVTT